MTTKEIQELRDWAAEFMGYTIGPLPGYPGVHVVKKPLMHPGGTPIFWCPDEDLNQCKLVWDRMRELGFHLSFMIDEFGPGCVFYPYPHDGKTRAITRGPNPALAILKAARAAKASQ